MKKDVETEDEGEDSESKDDSSVGDFGMDLKIFEKAKKKWLSPTQWSHGACGTCGIWN